MPPGSKPTSWVTASVLISSVANRVLRFPSKSVTLGRRAIGDSNLRVQGGRRPLLVSAHYDTVPGSPGADDNASGVAVLLECARALSKARLRRSVEFVDFDMEEDQPEGQALVGSTALVEAAGGKGSYEALYNLEMVGFTSGTRHPGSPAGFSADVPQRL